MTLTRTHTCRLKALSVLSHYICFSFLVSMGKLSLTTVSVFLNGALVISDVLSNYFTCMCIYRHKYLQVKETGNVVKIVSLTVFQIQKKIWRGISTFHSLSFVNISDVFWWVRIKMTEDHNVLVFSFIWCLDHSNYFGSAATFIIKINWEDDFLKQIYADMVKCLLESHPHLPFVKVFT